MTAAATLICLVGAAAGVLIVVVAARDRPVDLTGVLGAVAVAAVVVLGGTVVTIVARNISSGVEAMNIFGLAHVVYLAATLSVPLIGIAVCAAALRRRSTPAATVVGVCLVVPALLGIYATHIAPFQLRVDEVALDVPDARTGSAALTIAVLSDLQTRGVGDHERAAVDAVMAADPDIIVVPGDLFHGSADDRARALASMKSLLGRLRAPGGVYFVRGDVDPTDTTIEELRGTDVTVLDDEVVTVAVADRTVKIGGTMLDYGSAAADDVRSTLAAAPDDVITVLVSHRPDTVLELRDGQRVDLAVAGHTHGGQIAAPFLGPLMTLTAVPRQLAGGGLGSVDGQRLYVSAGVGMERGQAPQIRLGVAPVVGVIHLQDP